MGRQLADYIRKEIETQGPIPFSRFMELALYHPAGGYYRRGVFPGTSGGHFVTSPQASRLFGWLMAEQFMEMGRIMGVERLHLVEMGAGSGIFAKDVVERLRREGLEFLYTIVEPFPEIRALQSSTLGPEAGVEWRGGLEEVGELEGILFSNELLDAFPVEVIERGPDGWHRVMVAAGEEGLQELLLPLDHHGLLEYVEERGLNRLPQGYRTEVNLAMRGWIGRVASILKRGFVVTVDYGHPAPLYFHPSRSRGTLLGYGPQGVTEEFYGEPGSVDITAHVNFTDLCRWGREVGLEPVGYTHQWAFLAGQGIEEAVASMGLEPYSPANVGLKMLLLPGGMGESHKVMVQAKGVEGRPALAGFRLLNKLEELRCGA